jgi:MinD-like ATPase involved in chromosome partitioning or flagellar assembly
VTVLGAVREIDTGLIALTLARTLARESRVVCVDLALGASGISVASSDPAGPGIADVVRGTASFGQIISRDKLSAAHLVAAGRAIEDAAPILASQRLATTIEALAQTYDHVVVHAGAVPEMGVERFARLAPKAVLVAFEADEIATEAVRERLLSAGFTDVVLLAREAAGEAEPERSGTPVEAA